MRHPNASGAQLRLMGKHHTHCRVWFCIPTRDQDLAPLRLVARGRQEQDRSLEKDYILIYMTAIRVLLLSACAVHTLAFLQSGGLQTGRATAPVRSHAPAMATPELYLGIDAGTQSVKALL